jgi:FkbM family methyltransferase
VIQFLRFLLPHHRVTTRPLSRMARHPMFERFSPYAGKVPEGSQTDYVGTSTRCEFVADTAPSPSEVQVCHPPIDEEYFEWIDILESVSLARDRYTMLELGAGYGRWAVRAASAVRQLGIPECHLVAVEAEPVHYTWLKQHFCDNGLDPAQHTLVHGAVCDQPGKTLFYFRMPGKQDQADEWYGQFITRSNDKPRTKAQEPYAGFPVFVHKSGWKSIEVPAITLSGLLRDLDRVDLIDMDVQEEELKIVRSAIDELDRKVCRLHIGTHRRRLERGLRRTLRSHGWICHFDYPCGSTTETEFGPVHFGDGVQSWINPRFQNEVPK